MKKKRKKRSRAETGKYDRLSKALAMLAIAAVALPLSCATTSGFGAAVTAVTAVSSAAAVLIGFTLQYLIDRLTGAEYGGGFSAVRCALPLLAAAVGFFAVSRAEALFLMTVTNGGLDRQSLVPSLFGLAIAGCMTAGAVSECYASSVIISRRTVFVFGGIFLVMAIADPLLIGRDTSMTAICFAGFIVCAFFVMNQASIAEVVRRSDDRVPDRRMRTYNLGITGAATVGFAAAVLIFTALCTGVAVLMKTALFFILRKTLGNGDSGGYYPDEAAGEAADFERTVFGKLAVPGGAGAAKLLFGLFCIMVMAAVVFFTVRALTGRRGRLRALLRRIITDMADFFANVFYFLLRPSREAEPEPEEIRTADAEIHEYFPPPPTTAVRGRGFMRRLSGIRDESERLQFCYSQLAAFWRESRSGIRISDTPIQLCEKMSGMPDIDSIRRITDIFISYKYTDSPPDRAQMREVVNYAMKVLG